MPDTHDGLDVSPEPLPPGDLYDSTGSQPYAHSPLHFSSSRVFPQACLEEAAEDRMRPRDSPAPVGKPGSGRAGFTVTKGTPLILAVNHASPAFPVPAESSKWARLGASVWKAHSHKLDRKFDVVPPPRDVPAWLHCMPALCCPHLEESLFESLHEDELPMRYGIELDSQGLGVVPAAETASGHAFPAKDMASAPLLQFPVHGPTPAARQPSPLGQLDDGVLPFRATAKHTLAVFSLTGGTGRTSLAAGLARLLSGAGLRVLLVDTSSFSLLPRLFGAAESRQGVVRNFFPETGQKNRMISLISLAVEPFAGDDYEQNRILQELDQQAARVDRVVWDLSGAPLDWAARVLGTSPQILVPLLPSTNSLMQLRATERFLNRCHEEDPTPHLRYVLNHFDEEDALHRTMRDRYQQQLGSKLLRVSMRSSPLVDEALSCGRTVIDHAPASSLVHDLWGVAQQLHQVDEATCLEVNSPCSWFEA